MPMIPRGLTPSFVNRIKDEVRQLTTPGVIDRTLQRVRDEVKHQVQKQVYGPSTLEHGKPRPEQLDVAMIPVPNDVASIEAAMQKAGREWRIVRARYHDNDRDLEPISFRYWDKDDPAIPLVYCYCHKDGTTEAFKLKKFQSVTITGRFFGPRATPPRSTQYRNEFALGPG